MLTHELAHVPPAPEQRKTLVEFVTGHVCYCFQTKIGHATMKPTVLTPHALPLK